MIVKQIFRKNCTRDVFDIRDVFRVFQCAVSGYITRQYNKYHIFPMSITSGLNDFSRHCAKEISKCLRRSTNLLHCKCSNPPNCFRYLLWPSVLLITIEIIIIIFIIIIIIIISIHLPPWIRSFDLFRHRRIAIVSWGVHGLFFLEVCS